MKTTRHYSVHAVATALFWTTPGCSDDASDSVPSDTSVEDATTTSDVGTDIVADDIATLPDTLCETLWTRVKSCGHTTTFPGFEAWCTGDGQGVRAELEVCKVKPCAVLVTCLDEAGAPSLGL
ncbi:MAG: hypothetical protein IV100_04575 [Myxococcales bacterium]|nr:hypothetical protein [Myxococcales bacterium]